MYLSSLTRFDRIQPRVGLSSATYSSTPIEIRKHGLLSLPVSEISSASEKEQSVMSGIETMDTSDHEAIQNFKDYLTRKWKMDSSYSKGAKSYDHVIDILNRALYMLIHDKVVMKKTKDLELEDPRRLVANIASFERTRQIYAEKQSRF
ncbi:hypothetical protein ACF0H5_013081 [Mactra antiquata]